MAFPALIAKPTPAATFSSRTKAPTVELSDLASFAAQARSNKWSSRSSNESGLAAVFIKTRTNDRPAREPQDLGRNWSLLGRIHQKQTRPQDQPGPRAALPEDDRALIRSILPEMGA